MQAKDDIEAADAAHGTESTSEPGDAAAAQESADETIARLEAERDEALAHHQRAMADYQNLRRRTQGDIDAAVKRARGEVLAEALTVLDYLDMALATECTSEEGKNLQVGVAMTRGQLQQLLERFKVRPMPETREFDPRFHQAFATVETADAPPGTVMEVFRKGWMCGDDVLRHAQVRVAAAPRAMTDDGGEEPVEGVADESRDRVGD